MVLSFLESIWMWCKALNIGNRAPSPGHLCVLTMECVKDWHRSAKYSTLAGLLLQNVHVINWNAVWAHTYTYSYFTHGPKWVVEIFYACMHIHTETDTHTHTQPENLRLVYPAPAATVLSLWLQSVCRIFCCIIILPFISCFLFSFTLQQDFKDRPTIYELFTFSHLAITSTVLRPFTMNTLLQF